MPSWCEMKLAQYYSPHVKVISLQGGQKRLRILRFLLLALIIFLFFVSLLSHHGDDLYQALSSQTGVTQSGDYQTSSNDTGVTQSADYQTLSNNTGVTQSTDSPAWRKFIQENFYKQHYHCPPTDKSQFSKKISGERLEKKLSETSPRKKCGCQGDKLRFEKINPSKELLESHCSAEATTAGENQKVISFSLFGKQNVSGDDEAYVRTRYFRGIAMNFQAIQTQYPGWLMRIYTNLTFEGELCRMVCAERDIYFCDVKRLEGVTDMHPMTWRFLPLGDPTVTKFLSRDLDSIVNLRERSAVTEWEKSGFPFHAMRDHPYHGTSILGGMWGADNTKLCYQNGVANLKEIMKIPWTVYNIAVLNDQNILTAVIYTQHASAILVHDSYLCSEYQDSIPFPTQRGNNYDYVGRLATFDNNNDTTKITPLSHQCPIECRPPNGLDWEYC